jgi:hypothetical protein
MRRKRFLSFLLTIFLLSVGSAQARDTGNYTLTYDVYAGGIHALDAHLVIGQSAGKYEVELTSETHGFLGTLAPWSGTFSSKGWAVKDAKFQPGTYISESVWRGEAERKTYAYDKSGKFISYKVSEDGKDKTPKDLDKTLAKDTTDLLAATMNVMANLAQGEKCEGKSRIFDGDRNFDLVFHPDGEENLKKSRYNIYEGPTRICTVEVKPKDGKWRKKPRGWLSIQEQGRKKGGLPTVWMAPLVKGSSLYVPVKIRVKTDYGTLFMHLTSANAPQKVADSGK